MIKGIYDGYDYLNIIDAYINIAWEGINSGYSPDDPCVNSLSNFRKICSDNNIQLKHLREWCEDGINIDDFNDNDLPAIFIVSAYSKNIDSILNCVRIGANLAYIDSSPIYITDNDFQKEKTETIRKISKALNTETLNKEKYIFGKGNIFILKQETINDLNIEPGPFGKVSNNIIENKKNKIREIVSNISLFNLHIFSAKINSKVITQPVNETLFFEIEVKNNSLNDFKNVNIEVYYPDELYPISNVEILQKIIRSNSSFNIRQFCIPTSEGFFNSKISLLIKNKEIYTNRIDILFSINVLENYKDLLAKSIPKDLNLLSYLDEFQELFKPPFNSKKFKDLLNTDPETLIIKIRKIAESFVKRITENKLEVNTSNLTFASSIFELHKHKIIDNKMNGFINTVRIIGNMAAHSNLEYNTIFNEKDAFSVANAFISFVSDCIDKKLI